MNQDDERQNGTAAAPGDERQYEPAAPASGSAESAESIDVVQAAGTTDMAETPEPASPSVAPTDGGEASSQDATAKDTVPLKPPASGMPASSPLAAGAMVGTYRILRMLRSEPGETVYLAEERQGEREPEGDVGASEEPLPPRRVRLYERAPGSFAGLQPVVRSLLRHPRLLAPREVFEQDGKAYLVVEALVASDGTEPVSVAAGARLEASAALAAGAGLADALSYLHRNGVAHLHVSPDEILVLHGRAYLTGMEGAERISEGVMNIASLFARDANFLARSLGILAGVTAEPHSQESPADALLRQVAALGASGSFTSPDEVASICASGLQTSPSLSLESPESQSRLSFLYGTATTVGRVRSQNQDASASVVFDIFDDVSSDMPLCIFLVADGMGGEARGEMASRIAARALTAEMARQFTFPTLIRPVDLATGEDSGIRATGLGSHALRRALQQAVGEANRRVRLLAGYLGQTTGTTLTAFAVQGSHATLAHLGDSRAYLLRGDAMTTLTEDHSVLARLQAIDHPLLSDPDVFVPRNMLYRSLGQEDDPNPDMMDLSLADGDRILICSDGLWDELDDQTLAETLASASDPRECAAQLVTMANDAGGNDNSTAVVVFVQMVANADQPAAPEAAGGAEVSGSDVGEPPLAGSATTDETGGEAGSGNVQPVNEP